MQKIVILITIFLIIATTKSDDHKPAKNEQKIKSDEQGITKFDTEIISHKFTYYGEAKDIEEIVKALEKLYGIDDHQETAVVASNSKTLEKSKIILCFAVMIGLVSI